MRENFGNIAEACKYRILAISVLEQESVSQESKIQYKWQTNSKKLKVHSQVKNNKYL